MELYVGYGQRELTPPMGVELSGYGYFLERRCDAVQDPLYARALAFRRQGDTQVLINCDLLGLGGAKIAGAESNGRVFIKPRSGGECERPAGEWNCAEIVCVGDHIAVCVNGVLQNECTGSVRSGYIALQSEGGPVEFRNIWLTRLRRGI